MTPFSPYFRQIFTIGEPLLVPFLTSLNADISGMRKYIKKRSKVLYLVLLVLSYQKIKIFMSCPL